MIFLFPLSTAASEHNLGTAISGQEESEEIREMGRRRVRWYDSEYEKEIDIDSYWGLVFVCSRKLLLILTQFLQIYFNMFLSLGY